MFELWLALQVGVSMDINRMAKLPVVHLNFDTWDIFTNCKLAGPESRFRWFDN